jgi:peroxiredoxin
MESDECPPAPDFDVTTIENTQISFAELKGKKPVYLKFWLSWCPTCIAEMPHFVHAYEQFGDGIEVIAVNLAIEEDMQTLRKTISDFGLEMPLVFDESGEMQSRFGVFGTPTHVVINVHGDIIHFGNAANQELDAALDCVYR